MKMFFRWHKGGNLSSGKSPYLYPKHWKIRLFTGLIFLLNSPAKLELALLALRFAELFSRKIRSCENAGSSSISSILTASQIAIEAGKEGIAHSLWHPALKPSEGLWLSQAFGGRCAKDLKKLLFAKAPGGKIIARETAGFASVPDIMPDIA